MLPIAHHCIRTNNVDWCERVADPDRRPITVNQIARAAAAIEQRTNTISIAGKVIHRPSTAVNPQTKMIACKRIRSDRRAGPSTTVIESRV